MSHRIREVACRVQLCFLVFVCLRRWESSRPCTFGFFGSLARHREIGICLSLQQSIVSRATRGVLYRRNLNFHFSSFNQHVDFVSNRHYRREPHIRASSILRQRVPLVQGLLVSQNSPSPLSSLNARWPSADPSAQPLLPRRASPCY